MTTTPKTPETKPADWEALMRASADGVESDKVGTVINDGKDAESPAPMRVSAANTGYIHIWNRKTGDESLQPHFMLWQRMQQKDENGQPVFTMTDPGFRPSQGTIKCLLHESDPSRKDYDRMGFAVCNKANIPTLMDLESHMKYTHPRAHAALARDKEERDRQAAVALQQANLEALQALAGRIPAPTPEKPPLYVKQPK